MTTALAPTRHVTPSRLAFRADARLPAGVIGQVEGVALVYDVVDSHGTTFARGCIDHAQRMRVSRGKVRLFLDHGDLPSQGMYDTHLHIGVVRELIDEQGRAGWLTRFRADLFDTASGREAHEYLKAVAATGAETGVSIGMMDAPVTTRCTVNGVPAQRITSLGLGEISITAMPSVPGTMVTAVRSGGGALAPMADRLRWAAAMEAQREREDAPPRRVPTTDENWRAAGARLRGAPGRQWARCNARLGDGFIASTLSPEDRAFVRVCMLTGGTHLDCDRR